MNCFKVVMLVFVYLLAVVTNGVCADPTLTTVLPSIAATGDIITVSGDNFDTTTVINITDPKDGKSIIPIKPDNIINSKTLQFKAPSLKCKSTIVSFTISNTGSKQSAAATINYYSKGNNPDIDKIIILKNDGMQDADILERISEIHKKEVNSGGSSTAFSGVPIEDDDQYVLKNAGFNSDFIAKLAGIKQYVTIGTSAIYLAKTNDLVAAPIVRIFLTPKSYYAPRVPLFTMQRPDFRSWLGGIAESIDLNIGYTIIKSKLNNSTTTPVNTNFLLAGASYEINKAALLNFGWAIPTNSSQTKQGQLYFGITLDYNILKQLQIAP